MLAILLMAGAAATQPTLAVIMKPLLDEGFSGVKPHYVWSLPLAVVGLIFVRGVCNFFSDYLLAWVANNVLLGMRRDMFERLLGLPDADFKTGDTGRLLNRFTIDAGNVTGYATDVISVLVRETLVVIALICVLLYMSWVLTLIILIMLPVSVLVARVFIKRLRSINRDTVNMNAELTRVVSEGIDGQRVIKLFDGYEVERGRFAFVSGKLRRFAMRTTTADAALTPLTQVCISISVGAVIAVALSQANSGSLTVGSFASFMAALAQIFDPIKRLTNVAARMQKMLVSAESVFTLIDQKPEIDQGTRTLPEPVRGRVEFRRRPSLPRRRPRHAARRVLHRRARPDRGAGGPLGQRQDHAGEHAAALRAGRDRNHPGRRRARQRPDAAQPALASVAGQPGRGAVRRHHRRQRRLRRAGRGERAAGPRRARRRQPAGIRRGPAQRPADPGGRERRAPVRRPAPAPGDRARPDQERAHPDPGRGHLGPGQRVRSVRFKPRWNA